MAERRFNEDEPVIVSIRCITYNHAPYIRQCLEGFVMQRTNFRFQAVVHDDASTDGTTEIVREYAEKYPDIIVPVYEEENRWSKHDGSLLTVMYPLLVGKYLAHCEGDDFWTDPYKLQKQVDFLEAHPDYVLTYTDYSVVDRESKGQICNRPKTFSGDCSKVLIEHGNFLCTPTSLYLRKYDDGWPEFLFNLPVKPRMSDYVHWLFLSSYGKFKYIDDRTASYRKLAQSASHFDDFTKAKLFQENARQVRLYFNERNETKVPIKAINKNFHEICIRTAMMYSRRDFVRELKDGIKESPSLLISPKIWALTVAKVVFGKTL